MLKHSPRLSVVVLLFSLLFAPISTTQAADFKREVIYQIITDRFFDGSSSNNNPSQSSGLYDSTKTNWRLLGRDLAGIQQKMSYLAGLGVTAIWISPPVDNLNTNIPDGSGNPTASYHGYQGATSNASKNTSATRVIRGLSLTTSSPPRIQTESKSSSISRPTTRLKTTPESLARFTTTAHFSATSVATATATSITTPTSRAAAGTIVTRCSTTPSSISRTSTSNTPRWTLT